MNTDAAATTRVRYNGRDYTVTSYVDPYPGRNGLDKIPFRETCSRCGGTGIFRWWNAMGECRGTCFLCLGARYVVHERAVRTLRREAKIDAVWREYGDELRAEAAAAAREAAAADEARRAAEAAEKFAADWDAAHAEQARRNALVSGFVANIDDKVDAVGTVDVATTFVRQSFRGYGTDTVALVVVTLDDGHVVKTTGTGLSLYGVERGDRVRIRGTVKEHDNYRGQDQTVLTRAKVSDPA